MRFLGNIKSFHSAKFRFTFTHVYIHDIFYSIYYYIADDILLNSLKVLNKSLAI